MKILCAISHGLYSPWIEIAKNGQEKTWLNEPRPENFEVIHYHATPLNQFGFVLDQFHEKLRWSNRFISTALRILDYATTFPFLGLKAKVTQSKLFQLTDPAIHVHFPDTYLTYRWKGLAMFRYVLKHYDFDYLFITTTSSYIRPFELVKTAQNFPRNNLFAGAKAYEGANFAAGSNRFISRDLLEKLVNSKRIYSPIWIEDVSLSKSLLKFGVSLKFVPHMDINSLQQLRHTTDSKLLENYHYR